MGVVQKLPFEKYNHYLKNRNLNVNIINYDNKSVLDLAPKKWKNYLQNFASSYLDETLQDINIEINPYQHYTTFTASIYDIVIYFIYLSNKYDNLYIPKITNIKSFSNPQFTWMITYNDMEKNLSFDSNIINSMNEALKEKKYDFGLLFLSIKMSDTLLHANILLYDFKRLTIERFEPYGDDGMKDKLDSLLMEVLNNDNKFKYLKPSDFLTKPGYQLLSNENDNNRIKNGDFGGFCLGWCIWYIEHRIRNKSIKPKILNNKTLEKLLKLDDTLIEYIRNYSNKLYNEKFKIAKDDIKIPEKEISDTYLSKEYEKQIILYAVSFFK